MLGIITASFGAGVAMYKFHRDYLNWIGRFNQSSVHIQLHRITKYKGSYQLSYRTLLYTKLSDLIHNEYGIQQVHKAIRDCKVDRQFIKLRNKRDQWYFHGTIIAALEQQYSINYFIDGWNTNLSVNTYHPHRYDVINEQDNDLSNRYLLAMVWPMDEKDNYSYWAYLNWCVEGRPYDGAHDFQVSRKIRGFVVDEETIANISQELESYLHDKDDWQHHFESYLDLEEGLAGVTEWDLKLRWKMIGEMIKEYPGTIWSDAENPLCPIEIPFQRKGIEQGKMQEKFV